MTNSDYPQPDFTAHLQKTIREFCENATDAQIEQAFKNANFEGYRHMKETPFELDRLALRPFVEAMRAAHLKHYQVSWSRIPDYQAYPMAEAVIREWEQRRLEQEVLDEIDGRTIAERRGEASEPLERVLSDVVTKSDNVSGSPKPDSTTSTPSSSTREGAATLRDETPTA